MTSPLQSAVGTTGGSALSSATATFTTANISAGSKIIVAVACASSPAVTCTGVADAAANAWTKIATKALPAFGEVTLWALDAPAVDVGTKPAITATITAPGGIVVIAQEVPGLLAGNTTAMCDGTPALGGGTGGTSTGSPAYSTAAAGEYLVSIYGDDGSAATWTAPSGYTGDPNGVNTSTIDDLQIAWKNSTGGSETSSYTITSSGQGWSQIVVAFKLAAGGAAAPASFPIRPRRSKGLRHYRPAVRRPVETEVGAPSSFSSSAVLSGSGALGGAETLGIQASMSGSGTLTGAALPPFLTQILGSGQALYPADQYGNPYMLRWDTIWALIVNAGNSGGATTYQTDMDGYTAARSAEGFNGFLVTTTANAAAGVGASNNGNTWDGVAPFSSPGVLNNTFWTRVDYLIASAAAKGMTVAINAVFTYAIFNTGGPLHGWTTTQFQNYGAAIGARYASTPNVIWEVGDDYNGSWVGGSGFYDTQFSAFLTGLRGAGANQLISVENQSEGASRYSDDQTNTYAWGVSNAAFNWVYSYNASYFSVEEAYAEAAVKSVASLCNVKMDGWYDNQWGGQTSTESVELYGRKWIWWALSSGSRGALYGNGDLFDWPTGTLASGIVGATPGSLYVQPAALNTAWTALASLPGWHQLVPDTSSALVTAGRGTRVTSFGAGSGSSSTALYLGGNTYVTASRTPDGGSGSSLAVIYIPAATTITIDQTKMVSGYTATWVDPASGATSSATPGSTFNSTAKGTNSAGDHDWVLVLQASSSAAGAASLSGTGTLSATEIQGGTAVLAGLGTLAAGGRFAGAVALSGQGSIAGAPGFLSPAALSGLGTMISGGRFQAATGMAGSGTLNGSPTGQVPGAAAMSGQGLLTAGPSFTAALALAGSGTLATSPGLTGAVLLAGAGSLAGVPALAAAVTLAGSGTLAGTGPAFSAPAALSGLGSLAGAQQFAGALLLSGSGSLGGASRFAGAVTLAGSGSLGASGTVTGSGGAATLSGQGSLGAAAMLAASAQMTGSGLLAVSSRFQVPASLSGAGSLSAAGQAGRTGAAVLSGQGSLGAAYQLGSAAALTGSGSLGTAPEVIITGAPAAALSGSGILTADWTVTSGTAASLWAVYQRAQAAHWKAESLYREAVIAGGRGLAGRYFTVAYETELAAEAAYDAWLAVSGQ
jgi:hypothetical protein